jgi:hypothetical protein
MSYLEFTMRMTQHARAIAQRALGLTQQRHRKIEARTSSTSDAYGWRGDIVINDR